MIKKRSAGNDDLNSKAEKALKAAVAKLYEEHRRSGESLPIWHDGKVVWVKAGRMSKAS